MAVKKETKKKEEPVKDAEKKTEEKPVKEVKKGKKYLLKSEKELGFEKRNFFIPGSNKKVLLIAGSEVDEETYNLFTSKCKQVFFK